MSAVEKMASKEWLDTEDGGLVAKAMQVLRTMQ
jgi:hypothetical protein